eukprot:scaffold53659_cov31-Tisochrysis_lutea.AAC.2
MEMGEMADFPCSLRLWFHPRVPRSQGGGPPGTSPPAHNTGQARPSMWHIQDIGRGSIMYVWPPSTTNYNGSYGGPS